MVNKLLLGFVSMLLVIPTPALEKINQKQQEETLVEETVEITNNVVETDEIGAEYEQIDKQENGDADNNNGDVKEESNEREVDNAAEHKNDPTKEEKDTRENIEYEAVKVEKNDTSLLNTPNQEMPMNDARKRDGATYWTTSNIREWLNSDAEKVVYTNTPPDYRQEAGFLYEFTKDEREAIAVTKRRSLLTGQDGSVREGGSKAMRYVSSNVGYALINHAIRDFDVNWKNYYYHTVHDKVFLLSPHELHFYVQQRGMSLRKKDVHGSYRDWWSTGSLWNSNFEQPMHISSDGKIFRRGSKNSYGIVPALHLKPDTILSNGKKAHQLNIGETVLFGRYNHTPIEWIVINKTPDGYPLLWSDRILTIKQFQKEGEIVYRYSESVHFSEADVDITNDLKLFNEHGDTKPPRLYVENRFELDERKNESFTLRLKAEDENGIEKIILDDGTEVKNNTASVLIDTNRIYHFHAVDKSGNYTSIMIPVNNINPPATVKVTASQEGWTNQDVEIQIEASNDIEPFEQKLVRHGERGKETNLATFPNKISYAHKEVRITGEVELIEANRPLEDFSVGVGLPYKRRSELKDGYAITDVYPMIWFAKLSEIEHNPKKFDVTMTVGSDYFDELRMRVGIDYPMVWGGGHYLVEFRDIKFELLDLDDFEITKITLPNGQEVYDKRYTYTATETGTYTFDVLDNRGKVTSKSIDVKIDKIEPTLSIQPSTAEITHEDVILTVQANDEGGSEIKAIETPDGDSINRNHLEYMVKENGTYTFIVEDLAGNRTSKSITISNIDKTISFENPVIEPFEDVVLQEEPLSVGTNIAPIIVKDWRDHNNDWRIDVSATPLALDDGTYQLPRGTIRLKPFAAIRQIEGKGEIPTKTILDKQVIDDETIILVEGNNSRGKYELIFPENALELFIDPTTAKKGTYQTTIKWDLIQAP